MTTPPRSRRYAGLRRSSVPEHATELHRQAIAALLDVWRTKEVPPVLPPALARIADEMPHGSLVNQLLMGELNKFRRLGRASYSVKSESQIEAQLIDDVELILKLIRDECDDDEALSVEPPKINPYVPALRPVPRESLAVSIATTLSDYRQGEIARITPQHVERWICQFDAADRLTILQEMDHILAKCYVSKRRAEALLDAVLRSERIFGVLPLQRIRETRFLNIQRNGSSQRDMLVLLDTVLHHKYGIRLPNPAVPAQYVYLDDCLYSGNTAYYDLEPWLRVAEPGSRLHVVTLGAHLAAVDYLKRRWGDAGLMLHAEVLFSSSLPLNFRNDDSQPENYDCLWPEDAPDEEGDERVDAFVEMVATNAVEKGWRARTFRPAVTTSVESTFSSASARRVVERAFLKAGAYICTLPATRQPNMRPMGYEVLESLGFGAMFVTYRNIANNCPLALWWGDTTYPSSHPFSKWHPLIPRRPNESKPFVVARKEPDLGDLPF